MDNKTKIQIRYDREVNGLSYRTLAGKYGTSHISIFRMLSPQGKKKASKAKEQIKERVEQTVLPGDVKTLQAQLREARLIIELQDNMINIASKELGVDLRKKRDTRQSK